MGRSAWQGKGSHLGALVVRDGFCKRRGALVRDTVRDEVERPQLAEVAALDRKCEGREASVPDVVI